jgi:hypothetical protein
METITSDLVDLSWSTLNCFQSAHSTESTPGKWGSRPLTGQGRDGIQVYENAVYRGVGSVGVSVIVTASESAVPTRSEEAEESRTKMCKSSA